MILCLRSSLLIFLYFFYPKQVYCAITKRVRKKMHFPIDKQSFDLSSHGRFAFFLTAFAVFGRAVFNHGQGDTMRFFAREWGDTMHFFTFCGVYSLALGYGFSLPYPACFLSFLRLSPQEFAFSYGLPAFSTQYRRVRGIFGFWV